MNLPVLNRDLLAAIVTWAWNDAHPSPNLSGIFGVEWGHHNQGSWAESPAPQDGVCGTTYCIAGQAAHQVGYRMILTPVDYDYSAEPTQGDDGFDVYPATKWRAHNAALTMFDGLDADGKPKFRQVEGTERSIADIARDALGLDYTEGEVLFEASNSIERVVGLALGYAAVRGETLDLLPEIEEAGREYVDNRLNMGGFYPTPADALGLSFAYGHDGYTDALNQGWSPKCEACGQSLPTS